MNLFKNAAIFLSCCLIALTFVVSTAFAQDDVYIAVENMPQLKGGTAGLQEKLFYPESAKKAGITGRVYVKFIVNKQGKVENPKIMRGIGGGCDQEALRVIKQAEFIPGSQNGKRVRVQYTLPIRFHSDLPVARSIAIQIQSNPQGASIYLNGDPSSVGVTPKKLNVYPGQATLKLSKEGYVSVEKQVNVSDFNRHFRFTLIKKSDQLKNYITDRVTQKIKSWQQKGRYETTEAYQQRVTEQKRSELIERYTAQLVDSLGSAKFETDIARTNYDADNQTFEVTFEDQSTIYVEVPVQEAPAFDQNLQRLQFREMDFVLSDTDGLVLRKANIHNPGNGKTYAYDSGKKMAFNTTELAANFDPIDVSVETNDSSPNVQKSTRKLEVGKADVDVNVPETSMSNPDAIAVVIGNRRYQGDTPDVDYAVNDAKVMRKYLTKTLGFKPGNILYQENASRNEMVVLFGNEREQGKLANYLKPGRSDVFVFYSGHGAPDPNTETGYLMPVDADPTALSLTGYSLDVLYNNLGKLNAKSVNVVIDACFSGATGQGGMLVKNASPIGIEVRNPAAKLKNGFVVTASSGSQVASWYPEKRHGLLTYFWLKGLQGSADLNNDKSITSTELKQYLSDQSDGVPYYARRLHNRDQIPQVFGDDSTVIVSHK